VRNLAAFLGAAPPHLSETLDVPTYLASELIKRRANAWLKATSSSPERLRTEASHSPIVVVLDARDELEDAKCAEELAVMASKDVFRLLCGRTVIIDARFGGLDSEGLLDDNQNLPPSTLDHESIATGDEWARTAGFRVRRVARDEARDPDWPIEFSFPLSANEDDEAEELRVEVLRSHGSTQGDAALARVQQGLDEHLAWTANAALKLAVQLGLTEQHKKTLVAAAAIHDAGKARELWQRAMHAPHDGRPYAKTTGGANTGALVVNGVTYRHEFGSVGDAEKHQAIVELPEEMRELALHLVAAHHGYARPSIGPLDPDTPPSVAIERARRIALRFQRLQRHWGPWGLAWWEALLRAADWSASRAVNEQGDRN
jgi:CRISPR-associated endonuclease/helicase Cas3